MKKRVFITGGAGFIGSHVIHRLAKLGYETASFDAYLNFTDNERYYRSCLALRKKILLQPSKNYKGDIRNIGAISRAVTDFHPDVIVHLAGLPMARVKDSYAQEIIPINMTGTLNVLQVFEKSKAGRFVYTSSSMAYGHFRETPQTENVMLHPINTYGACKAAGEYFVTLSSKEWVIIRPTSVYGFTDCANRVTQLLIDAAQLRKSAWVVSGETLDFSYVEDVAEGFVKAVRLPAANRETFNISAGVARSAVEYADEITKYFPDFTYEVRKPTMQQVYRGPQDIQKAKRILHYNPKYAMEAGIKKTLSLISKYHFYKGLV